MGFWIFMLCMVALTPALMVTFGFVFLRWPPEDINGFYGYRTKRSMSGQQVWDYAQRYWGKLALRLGAATLVFVVLGMLPCLRGSADLIGIWGTGVLIVSAPMVIAFPIVLTERELKVRFG